MPPLTFFLYSDTEAVYEFAFNFELLLRGFVEAKALSVLPGRERRAQFENRFTIYASSDQNCPPARTDTITQC